MRSVTIILAVLAGVVAQLAGTRADAGAWPRDRNETFVALGGNAVLFGDAARPVYYDPTFYSETGLSRRLTLGADAYTAERGQAGAGFVFARLAVGDLTIADRYAVSGGAGLTILPDGDVVDSLRIGMHYGRGLESGWFAVDADTTSGGERNSTQNKLDVTWGHRFGDRWTSIVVATAGTGFGGDFYAKVNPSILYHLSDPVQIRAGYVQALTGDLGGALNLQVWVTF